MSTVSELVVSFLTEHAGRRFIARQIASMTDDVYSSRSIAMACRRLVDHGKVKTSIHTPTRYFIPKREGGAT